MNLNKFLIIVCLTGALLCTYFVVHKSDRKNENPVKSNQVTEQIVQVEPVKSIEVGEKYKNVSNTEVKVNYPVSLSYLTKNNILDLRKRYVSESIFANSDYKPSDFVFGQIEDKKPWMSIYICEKPDAIAHDISGPSEEARWIVNPTMLVALEYPFYLINEHDSKWCESNEAIMMPKSISYSAPSNEIRVTYSSLPIVIQNNSFYQFNGINARDLGYKYFYIDKSKSTFDVPFLNKENPSNKVMEFQNFIHLGSSCKQQGGCNNGSPRQPEFEFTYKAEKYTQQNAQIYIKLWKELPASEKAPADINEIIILENI